MALKIRLSRVGRNKVPGYRVVVSEARKKRDGRVVERLGHYNPQKNSVGFIVKLDRLDYWISKGALPTETVARLIRDVKRAGSAPAAA